MIKKYKLYTEAVFTSQGLLQYKFSLDDEDGAFKDATSYNLFKDIKAFRNSAQDYDNNDTLKMYIKFPKNNNTIENLLWVYFQWVVSGINESSLLADFYKIEQESNTLRFTDIDKASIGRMKDFASDLKRMIRDNEINTEQDIIDKIIRNTQVGILKDYLNNINKYRNSDMGGKSDFIGHNSQLGAIEWKGLKIKHFIESDLYKFIYRFMEKLSSIYETDRITINNVTLYQKTFFKVVKNLYTSLINDINKPLQEAIEPDEFKPGSEYHDQAFKSFDRQKYKTTSKEIFKLFKALNNDVLKKTLIFNLKSKKRSFLNTNDYILMDALNELGYSINELAYQAGFVIKNNIKIPVEKVVSSITLRSNDIEKKFTKHPEYQKKITFLEIMIKHDLLKNNKVDLSKFSIFRNTDEKIVFTYDLRAIASMSTKVGFTSCMNLEDGNRRDEVGSTMSGGVFIVYLVSAGDEYTLESPKARILVKPLRNNSEQVIWEIDKSYGNMRIDFIESVKEIIYKYNSQILKTTDDKDFKLDPEIYNDQIPEDR